MRGYCLPSRASCCLFEVISMGSLPLFFFLLCGGQTAKQNGKKATSKVPSVPHFVHPNDHANRETELKKKRVSFLPWWGERGPALNARSAEVLNGRAKARVVRVVEPICGSRERGRLP